MADGRNAFRFTPRLLPTLMVAALLLALVWLGNWQLERAAEKRLLVDAFAAAQGATPAPFAADLPRFSRVVARGRWDPLHQFLLDAMVHQGQAGFRVLTPFALDDGRVLLVDRGWVAGDPARRALPEVTLAAAATPVEIVGLVDELPRAGVTTAAVVAPVATAWPRVVLYPTREALAAALGAAVEPRLLRLDPTASDGYMRSFAPDFGVSRERHLAYATTWFALGATLLALWIHINLRARESGS